MPHFGPSELILIFLIVVVLFGASRIPQIGRGLGEGIRNFKKGLKGGENDAEQIAEKTGPRNP